jgi:hypothetical protein
MMNQLTQNMMFVLEGDAKENDILKKDVEYRAIDITIVNSVLHMVLIGENGTLIARPFEKLRYVGQFKEDGDADTKIGEMMSEIAVLNSEIATLKGENDKLRQEVATLKAPKVPVASTTSAPKAPTSTAKPTGGK